MNANVILQAVLVALPICWRIRGGNLQKSLCFEECLKKETEEK